jgi:hypothetical protein
LTLFNDATQPETNAFMLLGDRLLGRGIVSSAKVYRELADECLGWARTANSDKERRIFLQMAEAWFAAAAQAGAF